MKTTLSPLFCAVAFVGWAGASFAQDYPVKPIRLVVPFTAGGGTDLIARTVAPKLSETLGAPIVIDNRAGAGGTIGTDLVAKARPDGYTLVLVSANHAIDPSLYKKLPFDSVNDFAPVSILATGPGLLVVHPSLPVKTVRELIALAKARPGQLNYASGSTGTPAHLAAELFKTMAGVNIVHVPYKGQAPALQDLIGGQVSIAFPTIPSVLPHVRSNRLRALAATSAQRSRVVPEIPTIAESGLPGYDSSSWYGILAPAGTPADVVARLHQSIVKTLQVADVRDRLLSQGLDPVGNSPQEFLATIKSEIPKWAKVVQASGARLD